MTLTTIRGKFAAFRARPTLVFTGVVLAGGFTLVARDMATLLEAKYGRGLATSSRNATAYASKIRKCATAGPKLNGLLATIPDGPPVQRIAELHRRLSHDWVYRTEKTFWVIPTSDWIAPADIYVRNGLAGDCVGYSIVFAAAAARLLDLPWRVVTTRGRGVAPGHAFPEVFLGESSSPELTPLIEELKTEFGATPVVERDDEGGVWMSMDRDVRARFPNHECEIYSDGRLKCK